MSENVKNFLVPVEKIIEQADSLIESGFLPNHIRTKGQFMAIVLKGQEVGLPPMQSLAQINIIQGKPVISSEGMLSLVFKNLPHADIVYKTLESNACVIEARRSPRDKYLTFSFTIEDARLAGLTNKDNWRKYPRAMLKARCIAEMCRSLFPDCIAGISYTPEEINSIESENPVPKNVTPQVALTHVVSQKKVEQAPRERIVEETQKKTKEAFSEIKKNTEAQKLVLDEPGKYKITFGKHRGKALEEMDIFTLNSYVDWLQRNAEEKCKDLEGPARVLVDNAEKFLAERDTRKLDIDDFLATTPEEEAYIEAMINSNKRYSTMDPSLDSDYETKRNKDE